MRQPRPTRPRTRATVATPTLDGIEDRVGRHIAALIDFWGFGRHAGRVWTLLYLRPEPLAAPTIAVRLGMSAGSLSQTLRLLERWGAIRRQRVGHRLLHAQNDDVWGSVVGVLNQREGRMVRETTALLGQSLKEIDAAAHEAPERAAHMRLRLRALQRLSRAAEVLLGAIAAARALDLGWAGRLAAEVQRWRGRG